MKVVGYIRVSTEDQAQSGLSLSHQEEKIHGYASLHDLEVDQIYRDEGASAKSLKRPGIQEVLQELKQGDIQTLIIYKLDRLTRSLRDLDEVMVLCEKHKTALVSVTESIDTSTAAGRMMVNILGVVAQWEREAIAERTKAALSVKRAKREKTGGSVPYGYRVVAGVEEGETPQLEEHPREMKVLEKILWWREEKNLSYAKIANRLNERSVPTKLGRPWTKGTVKNVIDRVHRERLEGDMREANNVRSRFPGRKGHRKGL